MNISPVSFAGTQSNFQDLIKKPQAYPTQAPTAATQLNSKEKKKSPLKTVGKIALVATVIAGALTLAKRGGLFAEGSKLAERIPGLAKGLDTAGEYTTKFFTGAKNVVLNAKDKVLNAKDKAIEHFNNKTSEQSVYKEALKRTTNELNILKARNAQDLKIQQQLNPSGKSAAESAAIFMNSFTA